MGALTQHKSKCGSWLACDDGVKANAYLPDKPRSNCAGLLAKAAWRSTQLDCVHIHSCGNGYLGFRPDGGSLCKSGKVSKALLPHHSAPRLGSVCPNADLNPWAAATRHPWRGAANPAGRRVSHEFKPAFGQRGLTGPPKIKSRSRARSRATRFASWLPSAATGGLQSCVDTSAAMAVYP